MEPHDGAPRPGVLDGSRRSFFGVLLGLASAVVGALLAVPAVRYLLYPVTAQSDESEWATLGSVASLTNLSAPLRRTLDLKQRDGWRETTSQPVVYAITVAGKLPVNAAGF